MARQRIDLRLDEDLLDYIESSKGIKTRTAFIEAALRAQAADAERGDEAGGTNGSSAGRRGSPEPEPWPSPNGRFAILLVPHPERLRLKAMRIDRELRWLDREPVEGELTVTAEKLIPFHPDRSKYLDSRDFDATRERLQEEKELVDLELASPSPQEQAFIEAHGYEPCPSDLLLGAPEGTPTRQGREAQSAHREE